MNKSDQRECLIFAFRYALGRCSTAPFGVSHIIKNNMELLTGFDKMQIVQDIDNAIDSGIAGMECDVATWTELKIKLMESDK